MKKLMTMILAMIPAGIFAQSAQVDYAFADDLLNASFADSETKMEKAAAENTFVVDDNLLADPDFDIQENMITFTKDQKRVFFSANKKLKTSKDSQAKIKNSVQLHLFKADVAENGQWVNLEMLPFNSPKHSTGHPALNKDDTKLLFVADGPESIGKTDLFVVDLLEDGSYGKPKNLGSEVNSPEREVYPYIDAEDNLYFASDVNSNGESLEMYATKVIGDEPSAPIRLDVAVNSSKEELITALKDLKAETASQPEADTELRDLDILLEGERLAEKEMAEEKHLVSITENVYDFSSSNVVYTVQIGAFVKEVKTGIYKEYPGLFNHQYDDGYNRFYSGVFMNESEAHSHLQQMKERGFTDAFIVGLQGENRILIE